MRFDWKTAFFIIIPILAMFPDYYSFFNKPKLSYKTNTSSLADPKILKSIGIVLAHQDKTISGVYMSHISIRNSGNKAIKADDFSSPIIIDLSKTSGILSSLAYKKYPANLPIILKNTSNSVEVSPTLLNPNDSFDIVVISYDDKPDLTVSARISNISELTDDNLTNSSKVSKWYILKFIIGILSVFCAATIILFDRISPLIKYSTITCFVTPQSELDFQAA